MPYAQFVTSNHASVNPEQNIFKEITTMKKLVLLAAVAMTILSASAANKNTPAKDAPIPMCFPCPID